MDPVGVSSMEEVDPFSEGTDDSLVSYDKIIRV